MEEIEKLHNKKMQKKKGVINWTVERCNAILDMFCNIRFEFRCFSSFSTTAHDITSNKDDDDDYELEEENQVGRDINDDEYDEEASRTIYSPNVSWFYGMNIRKQSDNNDDDIPNCAPTKAGFKKHRNNNNKTVKKKRKGNQQKKINISDDKIYE